MPASKPTDSDYAGASNTANGGNLDANQVTIVGDNVGRDVTASSKTTPSQTRAPSRERWISSENGLLLRAGAMRTASVIATLPRGAHVTAMSELTRVDQDGIAWQEVQTDDGRRGWVSADERGKSTLSNTPPLSASGTGSATATVVPWGKCLTGLGMGNPQSLTPTEINIIKTSNLEAFKILTLSSPGENRRLVEQLRSIRQDMFIVARLFVPGTFDGKPIAPRNYYDAVYPALRTLYESNVRYFEVHNEPNSLLEFRGKGQELGWTFGSGAEYGDWFTQVLRLLRSNFPDGKYGFPGVIPQTEVAEFLRGAAPHIAQADWIGAHCYWQSATQPPYSMTGDQAGFFWRQLRELFPGKLVMVTEFSNNNRSETYEAKGEQYARYYQMLRHEPNVGAAFAFALSWPGQDANREGWELDGKPTPIPAVIGKFLSDPAFLDKPAVVPGTSIAPPPQPDLVVDRGDKVQVGSTVLPKRRPSKSSVQLPAETVPPAKTGHVPKYKPSLKLRTRWAKQLLPGEQSTVKVQASFQVADSGDSDDETIDLTAAPLAIWYRIVSSSDPARVLKTESQPLNNPSHLDADYPVDPFNPDVESPTIEMEFAAPDQPGGYRILWTVEPVAEERPETVPLSGKVLLVKDLQVLDVDGLLALLAGHLADKPAARAEQIKTIGAITQRPVPDELRARFVQQGLIPALSDDSRAVVKAALDALYALRDDDTLRPQIQSALRQYPDSFEHVRTIAQEMRASKSQKEWIDSLRPIETAQTNVPPPSTVEPSIGPEQVSFTVDSTPGTSQNQAAAESAFVSERNVTPEVPDAAVQTEFTPINTSTEQTPRIERSPTDTPLDRPAGSIEQPPAGRPGSTAMPDRLAPPIVPQTQPQFIFIPPSVQYAPPAIGRKVTIEVEKNSITLTCGPDRYASPNRLDYAALDRARHLSPEEYGNLLFDGLFNAETLPTFQGSTRIGYDQHIFGKDEVIFELDVAAGDPTLNLLKWEYLIAPGSAQPLAVFKKSPFFRLMGGQPPQAPPTWPLRVLVAICNPVTLGLPVDDEGYPIDVQGQRANLNIAGLKALDVDRERTIITDALDRLAQFGAVDYTLLDGTRQRPVTLKALRQTLADADYHILHIIAHGVTVLEHFHLVMEADDRREDLVPVEKFDKARFGSLRLVVLNTCQSASLSVKGALHGLAPHLIEIGVPAVVAMQDQVPIPTVQQLTQWFYHHLARSGRIDMALAATRLQLYDEDPRSWNWGIPVLAMSSDNGRLFEVSDEQVRERQMPDTVDVKPRPFAETDTNTQALSSYLASQAAQLGASPALVNTYSRWSSQPPSLPLADRQNRRELTQKIRQPVAINANDLKAEITRQGNDRRLQLDDEVFARIASALNAGKHIILIGPPGTGKTTLAQRICEYAVSRECAGGVAVTTATADWTTFDTVGGYVPTQQQTLEFRPGAFLRAIRQGHWLIIDEINRAEIDKAFGELFTLLSGQGVDLPYTVRDQAVSVRPPKSAEVQDWIPDDLKDRVDDYQYVVHPTWRIIGTMNVYDRSYLFAMSFAFMRRFAFIDCDLPGVIDELDNNHQPTGNKQDLFADLINRWLTDEQIDTLGLQDPLTHLIARDTPLMKRRALGPAIIRDMLLFVKDRQGQANGASALSLLGEAILLYAVPQLDGLDRDDILDVYKYLNGFLAVPATPVPTEDRPLEKVRKSVLDRIELLYPHIPAAEWARARS